MAQVRTSMCAVSVGSRAWRTKRSMKPGEHRVHLEADADLSRTRHLGGREQRALRRCLLLTDRGDDASRKGGDIVFEQARAPVRDGARLQDWADQRTVLYSMLGQWWWILVTSFGVGLVASRRTRRLRSPSPRIAKSGEVLPGSILSRRTHCGAQGAVAWRPAPAHGPYYSGPKVAAKTWDAG